MNYVSICIQNMLLDLLCYKLHSMSQILVIPHRSKKIGRYNFVVRRILSDSLLVFGLKKAEKHCSRIFSLSGLSRDPPPPPPGCSRMLALQFSLELCGLERLETPTRTEPSRLSAFREGGSEILFRLRESKFHLVSRTGCWMACVPLICDVCWKRRRLGFSWSLYYVTWFWIASFWADLTL
jgi:hypothetical protein